VKTESVQHDDVLLRGAREMVDALPELGLNQPAFYYHLQQGHIQCARRLGAKWIANRSALRKEFGLKG
jgi:hypothetical protein